MHDSVLSWGERIVAGYQLTLQPTLEVGSFDVNGSLRRFFGGIYVGVDLRVGPGVDAVASARSLPFQDSTWPVVVCTELLEHDRYFWLSVPEMARVLSPGGYLLLSTRGIGFQLHEYPADYWRFTVEAVGSLLAEAGLIACSLEEDDPAFPGVLALAVRP
jgi:SAM-dependent methyltransferase